ncbi:hypothetical protein IAR55_004769 [Kwoniella newhampshirensis]|uniref:Uncharacterized protein n=1 Tax=Kwoniella newhampshirensis TaxID=1651941 RepID=A0AAW0YVZ3_9TREE
MWEYIQPELPGPLSYFPFACRLAAFLLFAPFCFAIALDIIAYAIARTLHLSISQHRVPRSPPTLATDILSKEILSESESESSYSEN